MFTGIIEEVGEVVLARDGELAIRAPKVTAGAALGDSIAVDGVDLTVSKLDGDVFSANVMPETYRHSDLGALESGSKVNLERSVRPNDRLSGHIVRGVVEGTATIVSFTRERDAVIVSFSASTELLRCMVVKGPVSVDGVSLTITDKTTSTFSVSIVQYTQDNTTLTSKPVGSRVNIETDIIARYVDSMLRGGT